MNDERGSKQPSPRKPGKSDKSPDTLHIPATADVRPAHEIAHPFSLEELREAYRIAGHEGDEDVEAYLADLAKTWHPDMDVVWSEDTLLLVAMVSASARERVRRHAGWTPEELEARLNQRRRPT